MCPPMRNKNIKDNIGWEIWTHFFKKRLTERGRRIDLRKFRERLLRGGRTLSETQQAPLRWPQKHGWGGGGLPPGQGDHQIDSSLNYLHPTPLPSNGQGEVTFLRNCTARACLLHVPTACGQSAVLGWNSFFFFFHFFECWVNPLIQRIRRKCPFTLLSPDTKTSPALNVLNTF